MELGSCRLFADAVEILAGDFAEGLESQVGNESDSTSAPPLEVQGAVVESDPRDLRLDDVESRFTDHRLDGALVQERIGNHDDVGDALFSEQYKCLIEHVLAVQVFLAVALDCCIVGTDDQAGQ